MFSRMAKSITYIGTILLLVALSSVLIFSMILLLIERLSVSQVKWANDFAHWLSNSSGKSMHSLKVIGIIVFILDFLLMSALVVNYLLVNSKKAILQKISYFINIGFSGILFITTLFLLIFVNPDPQNKDIIKLLFSIIFLTVGLSALTVLIGGTMGIFSKPTHIVEINHKQKKDKIKNKKLELEKNKI